ncbi:MAG TPA: cupin domain-containing protein [Solirubrobacterales bacterium]|nr:cupin domain-containing protein [Solirubrobacterales bacterium]
MTTTKPDPTIRFEHDDFPERLTILEHTPAQTLVEVDLGPGGRTPMHVHRDYAEWFEVLSGTLDIELADRTVTLAEGMRFTAPAGVPHCFVNSSSERVRFRVALRDGQPGFLEMQLLLFGLRADGRTDAEGMPSDPRHMAVALAWSDTAPAGAGAALLLRALRSLARLTGEERRLRERYVTPAESRLAWFTAAEGADAAEGAGV